MKQRYEIEGVQRAEELEMSKLKLQARANICNGSLLFFLHNFIVLKIYFFGWGVFKHCNFLCALRFLI